MQSISILRSNVRSSTGTLNFFTPNNKSRAPQPLEKEFLFTSDAIEFYKQIYELKALQKVEILNNQLSQNKDYTCYLLQIDTIYLSYQIYKRYSEFYTWFNAVKIYLNNNIKDRFPKKQCWNKMNHVFVEERQLQLNDFIIGVLSQPQDLEVSITFMDFLQIRRQYIIHQIKLIKMQDSLLLNKTNPDEGQINQFIERLNVEQQLLTHVFSDIKSYFSKQKPKLTHESINALLLGCKQYHGLLLTIGHLTNQDLGSHMVCSAGLKLLFSFFDYEHNRDADTFIRIFCSLPMKVIGHLRLSYHIVCGSMNVCKQCSLKVLDLYTSRNNLRSDDQLLALFAKLQDNHEAVEEFKKWGSANEPYNYRGQLAQRQKDWDGEEQKER